MLQKTIFFILFNICIAHAGSHVDARTGSPGRLVPDRQRHKNHHKQEVVATQTGDQLHNVFPVPTASRCIVIMVCQYMIIYIALAVCRTYSEFAGEAKGNVEEGLSGAFQTMTYGPMLCVLFIACRMRVEFLSDGKGEPQGWVQNCMYAVTFAVLASSLLVFSIPIVNGKPLPVNTDTGDIESLDESHVENSSALWALTIVRYVILACLYLGLAGIIVGINIYVPPGADASELPRPAPAVLCTMILAVVFFTVQFIIAACRTYGEFMGVHFPKVVSIMLAAATTVEFAPMLCILFLAARMRALQHDSQPQAYAQKCMFACTGALCVTTLLSIAVPLALGGVMYVVEETRQKRFEVANPTLGHVLTVVQYLCLLSFYGGAIGIIYSIYTFEAPGGPAATLPVSPTVHCVVNLTCQFFFVYGMMTVMLTISDFATSAGVTGCEMENWTLFAAIDATKATLSLAPMLAILFVTTRMYALLITDKKGAPQRWVQDGMYMATWSMLISLISCLVCGLVMEVETDKDGNVVTKFNNKIVAITMSTIRYTSMLLLYGGIFTVIVGLFVMTPETANGRGSVPVLSDAVRATPVGERPPAATDVAGA